MPRTSTPTGLHASPDGEPRNVLARVGDLFPLDPTAHILSASGEGPSQVRPFGLRYARTMQPRAARHAGGTKETTGTPDGNGPHGEDTQRD